MECRKIHIDKVFDVYQEHYVKMSGGIDGYYEKTILDADIYEVVDGESIACFSVYPERGLTPLVVFPSFRHRYQEIFEYVIGLELFSNILFTEKDSSFLEQIKKDKIPYEVQSYNFEVIHKITSTLNMKQVTDKDREEVQKVFGEFIQYNHLDLHTSTSFIFKNDNELISFGAVEPLRLNPKRYCISMIVQEQYRKLGYGSETVKFLIQYLQNKGLEVNARCYVKNERSKKTLLKSGMIISNRLYKVEGRKSWIKLGGKSE